MRDHRLWHWLLNLVTPTILADTRMQRGNVVTAHELVPVLCELVESVSEREAFEVAVESIEHLIEQRELKPARCKHGKVRLVNECEICGHSATAVNVAIDRSTTAKIRERIWSVLVAHKEGLTRGELASKSGEPEKTVCWAVRDWLAERLCVSTGETRRTKSGRMARVVRANVR